MAWWVTQSTWLPWPLLTVSISIAAAFYMGGMALNDWYDVATDRQQQKRRPVAQGQLTPQQAGAVAWVLLASGVLLTAATCIGLPSAPPTLRWLPVALALALLAAIWLYDGPGKQTVIAPLLMGGCRALNVLLAASLVWAYRAGPLDALQTVNVIDSAEWGRWQEVCWVAGSLGLYVAGITWFARCESQLGIRWHHWLGLSAMLGGLVGYVLLSNFPQVRAQLWQTQYVWILGLLSVLVVVPMVRAIRQDSLANRKRAIVMGLRAIILLDAAACFLYCTGQSSLPALLIALLIFVSLGLKKLSETT
jgi:4-hydroxybenzoate polyprenyltransferase